jgi:hypothetical protein
MKLLRNPIVVGLLAVAAVVIVGVQFWPMLAPTWHRMRPRAPRVATTSRPAEPAKAPAASALATVPMDPPAPGTTAAAPVMPVTGIEIASAWASSPRWAESPRRDPFHGYVPPSAKAGSGPVAKDELRLQGVWRQTASTLAVINDKVLAEGDMIRQFRVETIQQDAVWVVGPNGREKLQFILPTPAPPEDAESTEEPTPAGEESAPAEPASAGPQ